VSISAERNVSEELTAIKAVADALEPLNEAGRRHVITYVAEALGIGDFSPRVPEHVPPLPAQTSGGSVLPVAQGSPMDIRTLKEQKEPRSANEMAALVAYYVSELLPPEEQRKVITSADIEKYFKQANFRLPSRVAQTLPDAARAGYFDTIDRGQYKLNPVGYNLVAHAMPGRSTEVVSRAKPRKSSDQRTGMKSAPRKRTAKPDGSRSAKSASTASPKKRAAKRS
jgi:hypothetical protein